MINIKLVVIGASGVGKTSLRSQFISGRFSNGYRATIGADFIAKALPHPARPEENVMLQIWDTAGQERFSSLSSAFFRGADAAILMFDVNSPETMQALIKWWAEFRERCPLSDEDIPEFPCIIVGNKLDLVGATGKEAISEEQALQFLGELVPLPDPPPNEDELLSDSREPVHIVQRPANGSSSPSSSPPKLNQPGRSNSVTISTAARRHSPSSHRQRKISLSRSPQDRQRSRSAASYASRWFGTASSTTQSIYHTPASSIFESSFYSARSSPEPESPAATKRRSRSGTGSSTVTMTPSLFARQQAMIGDADADDEQEEEQLESRRLEVERGPKLFFTSAKSGQGVQDVFTYVSKRVLTKWEVDEERRRQADADPLRIDLTLANGHANGYDSRPSSIGACCAT